MLEEGIGSVFKDEGEIEIGFLLVPNFPLVCLSSALDVLRHANDYAGVKRYRYRTYAEKGGTIRASNGLGIQAGTVIAEAADPTLLFVCAGSAGGSEPLNGETPETRKWLRHLSRNNTPLGGISAGTFILARAGLMDGYQCAVHWDDATVFRETFPEIDLSNQVFIYRPRPLHLFGRGCDHRYDAADRGGRPRAGYCGQGCGDDAGRPGALNAG